MKLVKVTINDVPEGCVDAVKKIAAVAVDRYYRKNNEAVAPEVITESNTVKDDFRLANNLKKKYYPDLELDPELLE
ncbi:MAG: hypothetical protein V3V68_04885 [Nitrosomonadaceae bacterium]